MGNLSSHEDCEAETPCPAVAGTPASRDFSYLDPRSPTLEIVRTPLEIPATHRSRLRRLVSMLDPRSPSQQLSRTPLQFPYPSVQPIEDPKPEDVDLGEIGPAEEVSVHAEDEQLTEHIDLKTARALFFGDMSMTASPVLSPKMKVESSPIKREEAVDSKDEIEKSDKGNENALRAAESQDDDNVVPVKEACAEALVIPAKPAFENVKCAELSTPPALARRQGKENALKKQLFHTPDKTRVRNPLSNVSSFHNSPLRR